MNKKESCKNTDYTSGFTIHHEKDGTFKAIKGEHILKAKTAKEIDELIKNFEQTSENKQKAADMPKKKPDKLDAHDTCVRTIAEDLKKDNWLVKANTEGWEKPSEVGGVVPDVMAHKGCLKRICQIVTEEDFQANKANYRDFKNYCREYDFQLHVIRKNGTTEIVDSQAATKK